MPGPSPLDPASSGWHLTPRAWRASEAYRALRTAEARHVAELILFDRPRFQDETHYFGGKAFQVRRGQLFDSEETIAAAAGTSRKVVRTVIAGLQVAGLVARERAHGGARSPCVITVLDYDLSQNLPAATGPRTGPLEGQQRARGRAPSKPQEPQEPQEPLAPPARRQVKAEGEADPRHRPLLERLGAVFLEVRGSAYGFQPRDARAITDLLRLSSGDLVEVERRWRVGLEEVGFRRCDTLHELAAVKWNAYCAAAQAHGARHTPARPSEAGATPVPAVDLSWMEGLPGARRELDERVARLTKEAAARMLPSIVEALRMEWGSKQAAAGGSA